MAVMEVSALMVTAEAATPPKSTAVASENPDPVTVTDVPPVVYPVAGLTSSTMGVASTVTGTKANEKCS
jgi:hypothetical protein